MNTGIHIGNNSESVKEFATSLVNILTATNCNDLIKYHAIQALKEKMAPSANITNCNFTVAPSNEDNYE